MATRMFVYIAIPHDATNVCQSSHTFSAAMTTATGQASASIQRGATSVAHLAPVAREHHQRKHRERQLQAQDDLAEDEQRAGAALAVERHRDQRGDDGDQPRDQPAQPRTQADVEEPFHDDLPGQRAGQRRVLAGEQQRDREQRARELRAEQRRQQQVGVARCRRRPRWPVPWNVAAAITRIAPLRNSADISATVESMVAKPTASRRLATSSPILARLDDRRVQVQVVRHHRRAEDADGDVEHVGIARRSPGRARAARSTPARSGRASASSIANEPAMPRMSSTTSAST